MTVITDRSDESTHLTVDPTSKAVRTSPLATDEVVRGGFMTAWGTGSIADTGDFIKFALFNGGGSQIMVRLRNVTAIACKHTPSASGGSTGFLEMWRFIAQVGFTGGTALTAQPKRVGVVSKVTDLRWITTSGAGLTIPTVGYTAAASPFAVLAPSVHPSATVMAPGGRHGLRGQAPANKGGWPSPYQGFEFLPGQGLFLQSRFTGDPGYAKTLEMFIEWDEITL